MSLFKINDLTSSDEKKKVTDAQYLNPSFASALGKRFEKCAEVIGELPSEGCIHFVNHGEWSSHDLLYHILSQTGPAAVAFATWSMSPPAANLVLQMVDEGLIKSIDAVLDYRIKVRNAEAAQLAEFNFSNIALTTSHAKCIAVVNEKWGVAVVGSANFTNNPRIEVGTVTVDKGIANFHQSWIKEVIKKSDPFEKIK